MRGGLPPRRTLLLKAASPQVDSPLPPKRRAGAWLEVPFGENIWWRSQNSPCWRVYRSPRRSQLVTEALPPPPLGCAAVCIHPV